MTTPLAHSPLLSLIEQPGDTNGNPTPHQISREAQAGPEPRLEAVSSGNAEITEVAAIDPHEDETDVPGLVEDADHGNTQAQLSSDALQQKRQMLLFVRLLQRARCPSDFTVEGFSRLVANTVGNEGGAQDNTSVNA